MFRVLLLVGIVAVLSGCAATKTETVLLDNHKSEWCKNTYEAKMIDGQEVSSESTVYCSDDKLDHIVMKKVGMAESCVRYKNHFTLGGEYVRKAGIRCKDDDGNWHIADDDIHVFD